MPFLTIFPFSSQWTKLKIKIYIFNNFLFSDVEMKFENCQFEVVFYVQLDLKVVLWNVTRTMWCGILSDSGK